MYTRIKNVQIIISLLKQHGIRRVVISPGSRNVPFVHSIETDPFFQCYSVLDERAAGYFALGLAEAAGEPVVISCTSATATCNYLPAMAEASLRNIPLVALTADRDYRHLFQMEDQQINQSGMYAGYAKIAVNLPIARDADDEWFCVRSANEALLELRRGKPGPVHINYQVVISSEFPLKELPKYRKISRTEGLPAPEKLAELAAAVGKARRILVLCGMLSPSERLENALAEFSRKTGAAVSCDMLSNFGRGEFLRTCLAAESMDGIEFKNFVPDLVITLGGHVWSFIKYKLRSAGGNFAHWHISPKGELNDAFKSLTEIFECRPEEFFELLNSAGHFTPDGAYLNLWRARLESVKYPELGFTNFRAVSALLEAAPENSLLHLCILNSTRLTNFANSRKNFSAFANLGADGIDGSLSTFLGQSKGCGRLAFIIIGDLSFIYDMGSLNSDLSANQRIFVINNFCGSEFYNNFGGAITTLPKHIAAAHKTRAETFARSLNVKYLSASNDGELAAALAEFAAPSGLPIILEVFTKPEKDCGVLMQFYSMNRKTALSRSIKNFARRALAKIGLLEAFRKLRK